MKLISLSGSIDICGQIEDLKTVSSVKDTVLSTVTTELSLGKVNWITDHPVSFGSSPFYFHSEQIKNAPLRPTPPVQLGQRKRRSYHQTTHHLKQYGIKKKFPVERLKLAM